MEKNIRHERKIYPTIEQKLHFLATSKRPYRISFCEKQQILERNETTTPEDNYILESGHTSYL